MLKTRTKKLSLIIIASLLLTVFPFGMLGARAADWTQIANNGVTNVQNLNLVPGEIYKGKLAVGSMPLPGMSPAAPPSCYLWNGSTFEQIGTDGFGEASCKGLLPNTSYHGDLYIGLYDNVHGGELYRWNGTGNPVLVPESENGWHLGANYTFVVPIGVINDELVVSVEEEVGGPGGGTILFKYNGTTWTQIVGGASGVAPGFGDPDNLVAINLQGESTVYNGKMIITVINRVDGFSIYSYDGTAFALLGKAGDPGVWTADHDIGVCTSSWVDGNLYVGTYNGGAGSGEIWVYNGTAWAQIDTTAIPAEYKGMMILARGSDLYVGGWANNGCRVFEQTDTGWTAISEKNFGQGAGDINLWALIKIYNGNIYAFTNNFNGGEIWSAPLPSTYYFAEGTTRNNAEDGNYEEYISIQNPGDVAANVDLTYMLSDGTTQVQEVVVNQRSRSTVNVNSFLGPNHDVSTMVTADQQIVAERPMYFNYRNKWTGGDNVMGLDDPRNMFFFAEGTSRNNAQDGSFEEWLCLQNPGVKDANVSVIYMLGTGENIVENYVVGSTSRRTVDVNLDIGANQDVSMVVASDQPIVAERPMYFNYHNKWVGGHNVVGAAAPDTTFYFAEGTTRDNPADGSYEEWLCLQNANDADADVQITYYTSTGAEITQDVTVPGMSRQTVDVKLRLGPNVDASCVVESNIPILAERPMYFNFKGVWAGGHNVIGCAAPMHGFNFAEGTTRAGFSTWVAVMNTADADAHVTFRYMLGDGTNRDVTVTVEPNQRYTREVVADTGANQDVSITVEADQEIVAERPMYFFYHDWAAGGSDTLGLNL